MRQSKHGRRLCRVKCRRWRSQGIRFEFQEMPLDAFGQLTEGRSVLAVHIEQQERGTSSKVLIVLLENRLQYRSHRARFSTTRVPQYRRVPTEKFINTNLDVVVLKNGRSSN